jgi:hypothetical protein
MITRKIDLPTDAPASVSVRATRQAFLRHAICDAARSLHQARLQCWRVVEWIGFPAAVVICCAVALPSGSAWPSAVMGLLVGAGVLALPVMGLAATSFAAYRRLWREQLRRQLARLPEEERAAVLLPLRAHGDPGTRALVEPLIRDLLGNGGEVTPCSAPAGMGNEVVAAVSAGERG